MIGQADQLPEQDQQWECPTLESITNAQGKLENA